MDQTSINSLSLEILAYIFEHLNYRHRVRVERVCTYWKLAVKLRAWKRVTRLKFTRKILCLKEPWKDWKREKLVVELSQAAILKLGAFSAIIQRCGPYLEELHLRDIGVDTRFGRFFRFMPHIKHLRIDSPLDKWHLELVDRFYSSQLISLAISYINGVDYHMFEQILRKATKLECLRVGNMSSLFDCDEQGYLIPNVTPNLKYLQVLEKYDHEYPLDETEYNCLIKYYPKLQLLFLTQRSMTYNPTENHLVMEQLQRFQLPFCNQLNAHPSVHSIKALQLGNYHTESQETLLFIAKNILQLEHLEFAIYDRHIDDLELLYPLKKLSSLRLVIIDEEYSNGGSQIDDFYCKRQNGSTLLLKILSRFNQANPLRNLEFDSLFYFSVENVMQYLRALTHLETFYCTIQRIFKIPPQERPTFSNTSYDFFCNELTDVLLEIDANSSCELKERPKRMFKFQVNSYSRNGDNDLVFKCDPYGNTSYYLVSSDVFWNCTWRIRSIVLREIMEKAFGVRTIRFFANQEGENISLFM